ncbi:hypothetical protein [Francisella persica]
MLIKLLIIIISGKHYDFNNTMFVSQKNKDAIVDQLINLQICVLI